MQSLFLSLPCSPAISLPLSVSCISLLPPVSPHVVSPALITCSSSQVSIYSNPSCRQMSPPQKRANCQDTSELRSLTARSKFCMVKKHVSREPLSSLTEGWLVYRCVVNTSGRRIRGNWFGVLKQQRYLPRKAWKGEAWDWILMQAPDIFKMDYNALARSLLILRWWAALHFFDRSLCFCHSCVV